MAVPKVILMDALLLLKTSPGANSSEIAHFLTTLPGARKVFFTQGSYSFVTRIKSTMDTANEIMKKMNGKKEILSFEWVEIGLLFE